MARIVLTGRVHVLICAGVERLTNNALAQADVVRGAVNSDGRGLLTHGILVDLKIVLNKRVVERPVTAESVHALVNGERELRAADLSGTDLLRATVQGGSLQLNASESGRNL